MLGWIASIWFPSAERLGNEAVHVSPASVLRSKCTRQVLGVSGDSVLLGATIIPSRSRTGLFLMGPRMPSGKRRTPAHVRPRSRDVRTMPHHVWGLGPTFWHSISPFAGPSDRAG